VEVFARAGRITGEHGTKFYVTNLLSKQLCAARMVRASFGIYNNDEEADALIETVREIAS